MMRMKVVNSSGGRIGLYKSIVRNLLRLVDGLPVFNILGIVLIAASPEKQRFGDRIAQTYVTEYKGS